MSRSGYSDDCEQWDLIRWRGQVASAIRGKRGQAFLRELLDALDAMPIKRLIANDLVIDAPAFVPPEMASGNVCAIGSVGVKRGVDMTNIDVDDYDRIAKEFGIAHQLVQEIEFMNDEGAWGETPEERWTRMRKWVVKNLRSEEATSPESEQQAAR